MTTTDATRDPVTHWTPEEHFYAECGSDGIEGDTGTLNEDKVTCPACRAAPAFDGDRLAEAAGPEGKQQ